MKRRARRRYRRTEEGREGHRERARKYRTLGWGMSRPSSLLADGEGCEQGTCTAGADRRGTARLEEEGGVDESAVERAEALLAGVNEGLGAETVVDLCSRGIGVGVAVIEALQQVAGGGDFQRTELGPDGARVEIGRCVVCGELGVVVRPP